MKSDMMTYNKKPSFLLEEKLTYRLRDIFIEISKKHGYLYKEKVYHKLLIEKFNLNNICFTSYPKITVYHNIIRKIMGNYYPDFLIENKIIVEIKAQSHISNNHINQLIRYLNTTIYEIGLIVNFGTPKAQIERRIFTNDRKPFLHG